MAGLHFKDSSSGGYFDREKEELVYDRDGEPVDYAEGQYLGDDQLPAEPAHTQNSFGQLRL